MQAWRRAALEDVQQFERVALEEKLKKIAECEDKRISYSVGSQTRARLERSQQHANDEAAALALKNAVGGSPAAGATALGSPAAGATALHLNAPPPEAPRGTNADRTQVFGRFLLTLSADGSLAGQGTFGKVYAATVSETGVRCAVKIFDLKDAGDARHEQIMYERVHAFLAGGPGTLCFPVVVDHDAAAPMPYLATSWAGVALSTFFGDRGNESRTNILKAVISQTKHALGHLHRACILHGDVKPNNIMFREFDLRVQLIDLGFAEYVQNKEWRPRFAVYYNASYRAPELHMPGSRSPQEALTFAADVWAYGCVVAELFRGKKAFPGNSNERRVPEQLQLWLEKSCIWRAKVLQGWFERCTRNPAEFGEDFSVFLLRCLENEPFSRPSFT